MTVTKDQDFSYDRIINNKIKESWLPFFANNKKELEEIIKNINDDIEKNKKMVFPFPKKIMYFAQKIRVNKIKVIILGQDPYINYKTIDDKIVPQATGLAFSVPKDFKPIPPSLKNMYKEIDINPEHGNLDHWVKQGVLLLNTALTVREGQSNSHKDFWTDYINTLIEWLDENCKSCVVLLMGKPAQSKSKMFGDNHCVIKCTHPSPLSAHNGFFGSKVFDIVNEQLVNMGRTAINWN